jgi:hypothetical protein
MRRLSAARVTALTAGPRATSAFGVTVMARSPKIDNVVVETVNWVVDRVN